MTKPTRAQIQAAAKAINKFEKSQGTLLYDDDWFLWHAKAALTAAAEVGEPIGSLHLRNEIEAFTIERCAQVVDEYELRGWHNRLATLAAAIRALKDKP